MHPDSQQQQGPDVEAAAGIEPASRVLQKLHTALSLAIACQHRYIESELGVPLGPVSVPDAGSRKDGQPLAVVVCAWCGRAGHAMATCADRDVPEERY